MKTAVLLAWSGAALVAALSASTALPLGTGLARSNVVLRPIYVGQGLSIVLSNGCSVSVFDAGGSDNGFAMLRKEYREAMDGTNQPPEIDVLLVSHIHNDHTSYLPKIGADKVGIGTFISNLSAKRKAAKLGILHLLDESRTIFKSVSTVAYASLVLPMNDRHECTSKKVNLELLWGTLDVADPEMSSMYMRHRENNDSVVAGVYGDIRPVLFLGDMNTAGQKLLLKYAQSRLSKYKGGVVVAGHHGFSNGIYEDLFAFLGPHAVIISRSHARPLIKKDVEAIDRHMRATSRRQWRLVECSSKGRKSVLPLLLNWPKSCQALVSPLIIQLSPNNQVEIVL